MENAREHCVELPTTLPLRYDVLSGGRFRDFGTKVQVWIELFSNFMFQLFHFTKFSVFTQKL